MKIVVTGSNGLVGKAVVRTCRSLGDEVLPYPRERLDISDKSAVDQILRDETPDALINCAAYTDVDGAETDPETCVAVNSTAVRELALASSEAGVRFVTISTDYVFDGAKDGFYSEFDSTNPLSVYGRAKLEGEREAMKANENSIVVRTGWIFGPGGSNFLSVIPDLLRRNEKVMTISDAYGTPTYADDLALRLRELADVARPGLYHVTNSGDGTSYTGFAFKTAEIGKFDSSLIEEVGSGSLDRPAARPVNSRLACEAVVTIGLPPLPHWHEALTKFLK